MKSVALYVRVSTEEQKLHGYSVDSQIEALKQYAEEHDYQIYKLYNDAGQSASSKMYKRTALSELLEDCKAHKIDMILFTKLDRWFRSVPDYYQVQKVLDDCGIPWRAIWEDYETETSSGKFKVNIMLSIGQAESQRTSERIKSVFEYKRSQGEYVGKAPIGYKNNHGKLVMDEESKEGVEAFFKTYLDQMSYTKAILSAYEHGVKIAETSALRMLKSSAYYGIASGNYPCDPYITIEEHEAIMRNLASHPRQTKENLFYYFSGLVYCEHCGKRCNSRSYITHRKSGNLKYKNYCCDGSIYEKHTRNTIAEWRLENYLLDNLERELDEYRIIVESESQGDTFKEYEAKKQKLELKLERIGIRFEDGDISVEEYKSKRASVVNQLNLLTPPKRQIVPVMPDNWKEIYEELDDEHRQMFWRKIIDKIMIKDGEIKIRFV